jgi:ATP-binding cassette subfamily C (CFTR/MRP) protein 2
LIKVIKVISFHYINPFLPRLGSSEYYTETLPISHYLIIPFTQHKRPLEQKDIPDLGEEDEVLKLHGKFVRALDKQKNDGKAFSVFWALSVCFGKPMVLNGGWALGKTVTLSMGPVVLKSFIDYTSGQRAFPYEGFVLVGGLFLAKFLESLSQRQWYSRSRRVGLQVRSALMAAIYQKDLRLSNAGDF